IPEPPLNRVVPFLIKDETPRVERVPSERSHNNGITGILSLTVAVEDPGAISASYMRVLGSSPQSIQRPGLDGVGVRFTIGYHALDLSAPKSTKGPLVDWIKRHGQSPYAATLAGPAGARLDPALLWGA